MPRRRMYRRRASRFQRFKRFAGGVGTVARLARDVVYLKSLLNVERKYLDVTGSTTYDTTGSSSLLNGMAPGDTGATREGQSIKAVSSLLSGFVRINASATQTVIRIILVRDKQPNGSGFAITNLLTAADTVSPLLLGNALRFKVYMDKRITLSITGSQVIKFKKYMKLKFHTRYNTGTAGTIADIQTNAYYLYILSSEATNTPTVTWNHRLRFIDN